MGFSCAKVPILLLSFLSVLERVASLTLAIRSFISGPPHIRGAETMTFALLPIPVNALVAQCRCASSAPGNFKYVASVGTFLFRPQSYYCVRFS